MLNNNLFWLLLANAVKEVNPVEGKSSTICHTNNWALYQSIKELLEFHNLGYIYHEGVDNHALNKDFDAEYVIVLTSLDNIESLSAVYKIFADILEFVEQNKDAVLPIRKDRIPHEQKKCQDIDYILKECTPLDSLDDLVKFNQLNKSLVIPKPKSECWLDDLGLWLNSKLNNLSKVF